ncbi:hypothetical protein HOY80DRAFT_574975 [Tuber brumale]|nr:hypothetical protein HOY80DRAFT_574975 [Tuber brumale]
MLCWMDVWRWRGRVTMAGSSSGGWGRISREVLWRKYRVNLGQFISQSIGSCNTYYILLFFLLFFYTFFLPHLNPNPISKSLSYRSYSLSLPLYPFLLSLFSFLIHSSICYIPPLLITLTKEGA